MQVEGHEGAVLELNRVGLEVVELTIVPAAVDMRRAELDVFVEAQRVANEALLDELCYLQVETGLFVKDFGIFCEKFVKK